MENMFLISSKIVLMAMAFLLLNKRSFAWMTPIRAASGYTKTSPNQRRVQVIMNSATGDNGVETISLKSLENHKEEGEQMASSIVKWLDAEWYPQEVHVQMAESAKQSYIQSRESGENDLMSIMMQVSGDLDSNWEKYDADAFVNAWDIGNYVSDYLAKRVGTESCDCNAEIY